MSYHYRGTCERCGSEEELEISGKPDELIICSSCGDPMKEDEIRDDIMAAIDLLQGFGLDTGSVTASLTFALNDSELRKNILK